MLLQDPLEGCFFCKPEPWRTIFTGQHTQIVAGAGPLCPGYCILAPRSHIHTVADLDEQCFWEFIAVFELLKLSLTSQYRPGFTAYEHGRIGACRTLEVSNDFSTFCHHAHRVVLPVHTDCVAQIEPWFESVFPLESPASIRRLADEEYVYYEVGFGSTSIQRLGFTGHKGIPSQFMRRILTTALNSGRDWSWATDPNYEEMIDTVARLRGEFVGISAIEGEVGDSNVPRRLRCNVSLDGFAYVGKTTIAESLRRHFKCPVIDTGVIFRHMAFAKLQGMPDPTHEDLKRYILEPPADLPLRTTAVTAEASSMASDPARRKVFSDLITQVIADLTPCIVVGRDTWRFLSGDERRLLIEADFETRFRRRFLWEALNEHRLPDTKELRDRIRSTDEKDRSKLPPNDTRGLIRVGNGQRLYSATLLQIMNEIGE